MATYSIFEVPNVKEARDRLTTVQGMASLDRDFRAEFLADPRGTLDSVGLLIPDHLKVVVFEPAEDVLGFTLPAPQPFDRKFEVTGNGDASPQVRDRIHVLMAMCGLNPEFRARAIRDPVGALAMVGLYVSEGFRPEMHDTPPGCVGVTIPAPNFVNK